jgi:hypothetical protein
MSHDIQHLVDDFGSGGTGSADSGTRAHETALAREVKRTLSFAAGTASAAEPHAVRALLESPDALIGKLFKQSLRRLHPELEEPGQASAVPAVPSEESVIEKIAEDSAEARRNMVDNHQLITSKVLCERLGISRQALSKSVQTNRCFSIEVGGEDYYPAFYADSTLVRKQMSSVIALLRTLSGASKYHFFTTPSVALSGVSPLTALRDGRFEEVKVAASAYAER